MTEDHDKRWRAEAEFFDNVEYSTAPIAPDILRRYLDLKSPFLPAEFPYFRLGTLTGKKVLEIGCGHGEQAITLVLRGAAHVTGIDISGNAIKAAKLRAAAHGIGPDRVSFVHAPLEQYLAENSAGRFDVICGFAILHHLLPVLVEMLQQMRALSHAGTQYLFLEPIAPARTLRSAIKALRLSQPGTDDERPLNLDDLRVIEEHLGPLEITYFHALGRLARFFLRDYQFGPPLPRTLYRALCRVDRFLIGPAGLRSLASIGVICVPPSATVVRI